MPRTAVQYLYTCTCCLQALHEHHVLSARWKQHLRLFSAKSSLRSQQVPPNKLTDVRNPSATEAQTPTRSKSPSEPGRDNESEPGAMSRRLAEATEEALFEGGRAGRKAVEEAGFSEELKQRLLKKVEAQRFRSENASAFAEAGLTAAAGQGTRNIAAAQAWTGTESTEDSVLRMLNDAHKPLKPHLRGRVNAPVVDMRIKGEPKHTSGQRLANARDKTSIYATSKDTQMSEKEREAMRKELKDRFTPGARAMPNSIRGLAALANERIEDAIARGQFKNIRRGKAIERDSRADNPFLDTTEYIMNKMIQRQDIMPPWIEKQQELVKTANVFRRRLRNDWKRHAARTISSRGGSLQDQVRAAYLYAEAERVHNPKVRAVEQITLPANATSDPVMISITREATPPSEPKAGTFLEPQKAKVSFTEPPTTTSAPNTVQQVDQAAAQPQSTSASAPLPLPFRDSAWEKAELSYHSLAITNLNNLTRSYNLMAPDLAKKPYFSLERELRSCYADVAPELAQAIRDHAARPAKQLVEVGHRPAGVLERFGGEAARVYDSKKPLYGFREFWADLFGAKER